MTNSNQIRRKDDKELAVFLESLQGQCEYCPAEKICTHTECPTTRACTRQILNWLQTDTAEVKTFAWFCKCGSLCYENYCPHCGSPGFEHETGFHIDPKTFFPETKKAKAIFLAVIAIVSFLIEYIIESFR